MRIAVIGGGVSGLVAASVLGSEHEITLYEARPMLGGHVNTIDVKHENQNIAIDTGFIVYNELNYPNFTKLLLQLGVASQPTTMSFSVHRAATAEERGYEYNGSSLNGIFAQRRNLWDKSFLWMLREIVRFNKLAKELAAKINSADETSESVQEFLDRHGFTEFFTRNYLLPMGAAIWSCPLQAIGEFPIKFLARFYDNHGLLNLYARPQWRVIRGGSRTYVEALAERLQADIRCGTRIENIVRSNEQVLVKPQGGAQLAYDHVILACHSDQALRLLATPTAHELEVLRAIPYQTNIAVLHTDARLMPSRRRAWACWNYRGTGKTDQPPCVTYWMNELQSLSTPQNYFVTLNAENLIEPAKIIQTIRYEHPVFTSARPREQLVNLQRISYAGAYWGNGFHEDGVVSGLRVAEALKSTENKDLNPPLREFVRS